MSRTPKKKTQRSKAKFPGLDNRVNLKIRHEELSVDYLNQLNDKEKQWLSNFNEEYVSANFNHTGKLLHKTKKLRRDCYSKNNSRNRDALSITKTNDMLKGEVALVSQIENSSSTNPKDIEDVLIEKIDSESFDTDELE